MVSPDLRPLDGIRALANVWILVFHALFLIIGFLPEAEVSTLAKSSWLLQHGYLAVDGFFVLTGLLLAMPLLRKPSLPEGADRFAYLRRYYAGRFLRILIPILLTLLVVCQWLNRDGSYLTGLVRLKPAAAMMERFFGQREMNDNGCGGLMLPSTLLHLSFLMPFNGGCSIHGWSVAVQYHAYLWLPVTILFFRINTLKQALRPTLVVVVVTAFYRIFTRMHHSTFEKGSVIGAALDLWHYGHVFARMQTMVLGVLLAFVIWRSNVASTLSQRTPKVTAIHALCWTLSAVVLYLCTQWERLNEGEDYRYDRTSIVKHSLFVAFFSIGSLGSSLVWCWIIFCAVYRFGPFASSSIFTSSIDESSPAVAAVEVAKKTDEKKTTAVRQRSRIPASPNAAAPRSASRSRSRSKTPSSTKTKTEELTKKKENVVDGEKPIASSAPSSLFGLGLSSFLSTRFIKLLADLSYWSYLVHLFVYTVLFTRPWLLYPPSGEDLKPASLVIQDVDGTLASSVVAALASGANGTTPLMPSRSLLLANGTSVALTLADVTLRNTNRTFFLPSSASAANALVPLVSSWFALREQIWPSGQPLTLGGLWIIAIVGAVLSYIICYAALRWVEEPLRDVAIRRWLFRGDDKKIEAVSWWYSMAVMAVGGLAILGGTGWVLFALKPEMEALIPQAPA